MLTALTQPSPEALREAIRETRRKTDKPFGVNVTFLPTINPPDYEGYTRAAVEEGVRIFETAGNNRKCLSAHGQQNSAQHYMWACDSKDGHCVFEGRRLHDYTQMHEYPACKGAIRLESYCTLF